MPPTRYPRQGENLDFGRVAFSRLGAVDRAFVALTVIYLAFVALLPFPTGVLGEFGDNPVSVVAFAVNMMAVSTMEAVLFRHADGGACSRRSGPRTSTGGRWWPRCRRC